MNKGIRRRIHYFEKGSKQIGSGLLLLKPKSPFNSSKIARKIANFNGVKEVSLTSGEYAFVVLVNRNLDNVKTLTKKALRRAKISAVVRHYSYAGI